MHPVLLIIKHFKDISLPKDIIPTHPLTEVDWLRWYFPVLLTLSLHLCWIFRFSYFSQYKRQLLLGAPRGPHHQTLQRHQPPHHRLLVNPLHLLPENMLCKKYSYIFISWFYLFRRRSWHTYIVVWNIIKIQDVQNQNSQLRVKITKHCVDFFCAI